jgi:transcriptional regulator of nitric oxide reductase
MPWYSYKRGGWDIAVDAINQRDAAQHIKTQAPGAVFRGQITPPTWNSPSMATAMVTARRDNQIRAACMAARRVSEAGKE